MLVCYVAPHKRLLFVNMEMLGKMDDEKYTDSWFEMPTDKLRTDKSLELHVICMHER